MTPASERVWRRVERTLDGHRERREGDEMACCCGKRWPIGEDHP